MQPGCGSRVMEALPRGIGWKLMTTGGAARAQVLDSCLLTYVSTQIALEFHSKGFEAVRCRIREFVG